MGAELLDEIKQIRLATSDTSVLIVLEDFKVIEIFGDGYWQYKNDAGDVEEAHLFQGKAST